MRKSWVPAVPHIKPDKKLYLRLAFLAAASPAFGQGADWGVYGGEGGRRFSSLTQITKANVGRLAQAWRFDMAEAGDPQTHPLAIDGVVYAYTPSLDTIALDGATGKLKWRFHSGVKAGGPQRGLLRVICRELLVRDPRALAQLALGLQ